MIENREPLMSYSNNGRKQENVKKQEQGAVCILRRRFQYSSVLSRRAFDGQWNLILLFLRKEITW